MKIQQEADSGFDGVHYLPWTLRTTPRDPIPDKQQLDPNWTVECQNQNVQMWDLRTPSGLPFSLVSSCMQASVRQSRISESLQWSLEMLATDAQLDAFTGQDPTTNILVTRKVSKAESNLWNRLAVITAEDVGLANVSCVVIMARVFREKQTFSTYADAQRAIMNATVMLARSNKSRAVDWACGTKVQVPEPFEIVLYYNQLIQNLLAGNHPLCIGYADGFINASLEDKEAKLKDPVPKELFGQLASGVTVRGKSLKFYKNKRQIVWVAIMKVVNYLNSTDGINVNGGKRYPTVTEVVESCYDLAHDNAFRWTSSSRLFERMALLTLCLKDAVEARGLAFHGVPLEEFPNGREFTFEDLEQLRMAHRNGNLWYGVPDLCKCKHTLEGKQLGRGIQHFIEVKSFLRHEDPALIELSDFYLALSLKTKYAENSHFDRSGMTIAQYVEWLPMLRKRFDTLNQIEDTILKSTITITFGNAGESHVGMQIIGNQIDKGFTCAELMQIGTNFMAAGFTCELYNLQDAVKNTNVVVEEASILIIRNAAAKFVDINNNDDMKFAGDDKLFLEMLSFPWDSKMFSRKHKKVSDDGTVLKDGVVSKHARHNVCFSDIHQEADFANGKGTIISWDQVPLLKSLRSKFGQCFGPKAANLIGEGNYYYDASKCGIGFHGDFERKIVIAVRLGASMSLYYQWYHENKTIGDKMAFILNHGDVYIMSEKAVGQDWKRRSVPTLRHAAGCAKYTQ